MRLEDANLDGLKGMPDVKYDFTVSSDLQAAFRAAASTLEGQRVPFDAAVERPDGLLGLLLDAVRVQRHHSTGRPR